MRFYATPTMSPADGWPAQVLDPAAHGYDGVTLAPGDYTARGRLAIRSSNVTYEGVGQPTLFSVLIQHVDAVRLDGLSLIDGSQIRTTFGTGLTRCRFSSSLRQPLRLRFGAHYCYVEDCWFERQRPLPTYDVVAIQISDQPNTHIRLARNTILNYTDGVQTTARQGELGFCDEYGFAAGLLIEGNRIGYTESMRLAANPACNIPGCEQAFDFKTGGTELHPVIVRNNQVFGCRPVQLERGGTAGYAITIHIVGTHIHFENNAFLNCESGVQISSMRENNLPGGLFIDPRIRFTANTWSNLRDNGSGLFPGKVGYLLLGISTVVFEREIFADVQQLEALPVNPTLPPRQFIDCLSVGA